MYMCCSICGFSSILQSLNPPQKNLPIWSQNLAGNEGQNADKQSKMEWCNGRIESKSEVGKSWPGSKAVAFKGLKFSISYHNYLVYLSG